MKKKSSFTTNYRLAWIEFRGSKEYALCWEALKKKGVGQKYANNILQSAFVAGWGDKEIKTINQ